MIPALLHGLPSASSDLHFLIGLPVIDSPPPQANHLKDSKHNCTQVLYNKMGKEALNFQPSWEGLRAVLSGLFSRVSIRLKGTQACMRAADPQCHVHPRMEKPETVLG